MIIRFIDNLLNKVTLYGYVLYFLATLVAISVILSFFGIISYNPVDIIVSTAVFVVACKLFNYIFGKLFKIRPNWESPTISALILTLITEPSGSIKMLAIFVLISGIAMLSKYIIVVHRRHIFNPAALALMLAVFIWGFGASWWSSNPPMFAFIVVGGLLLLRKLRWFHLTISFVIAYLASLGIYYYFIGTRMSASSLPNFFLYSSIFFFGFIMLTEPITMPSGKKARIVYGALIGVLAVVIPPLTGIANGLEMALLTGNVVALLIWGNTRFFLTLKDKKQLAKNTFAFVFSPDRKINFEPGQFMLWSLPHDKPDLRGYRRYFSLASSPTEKNIMITTKFANESSTFKTALGKMDMGGTLAAIGRDGSFTLPKQPTQHCVFIAGGVGIAPYRSMIKYLLDKNLKQPITLLYSNNTVEEIVFQDLFDEAKTRLGLKAVYTLTDSKNLPPDWTGKTGFVSADLIKAEVTDYNSALYYISGPPSMINAVKSALKILGIPKSQIKTDYFTGYA